MLNRIFSFLEKELKKTMFLAEPELLANERLKMFLRKESYYRAGSRKKRQQDSPAENGKAPAADADTKDSNTVNQKSAKNRKRKEKPYWEDY